MSETAGENTGDGRHEPPGYPPPAAGGQAGTDGQAGGDGQGYGVYPDEGTRRQGCRS